MKDILYATLIITILGIVCGALLAVASKFMRVKTDERTERIRNCLPGINCGACGFSGCDGYADALVRDEATKTNLCVPGAAATAKSISEIMGVETEEIGQQIAYIQCNGDADATKKRFNYVGISTCSAASLYYGGDGECTFGCIGFGDCAAVCPTNSIYLAKNIAHVNEHTCIGCELCAKKCPKHIIGMRPKDKEVFVACSNKERGAIAIKKCKNACIACRKCEKTCPTDAIKVIDNLARIDYKKCIDCKQCFEVCPTGCIRAIKK